MSQRFEGQFEGFDQTELFFQTWSPENVRGVLILTHGLAEHSECYHPLAKILSEDGWLVYGWDMRGHGRSEGKRGYAKSLDELVSDLGRFYGLVSTRHPEFAPVMFGHSLGGLVTLRFAESGPLSTPHSVESDSPRVSALALSSPCVGLSVKVPAFKEKLAHIALRWMPTITMFNEIKYEDLTRDEEILKSYAKDTLRHDKISPGIFLGMLENFPRALEEAPKVNVPVLMQLAGEDRIVSTVASREVFERLSNKKNQLLVYPGSYHEIFNDIDRDKVTSDLKRFLNTYLGA